MVWMLCFRLSDGRLGMTAITIDYGSNLVVGGDGDKYVISIHTGLLVSCQSCGPPPS